MDKDRDASGQVSSKQELHGELQRTRQSMSDTLGEIGGEISNALDWHTHFRRHPGAFLIGGGALGFVIGRAITGSGYSGNVKKAHDQNGDVEGTVEQSAKLSSGPSSVRRIIDMTASALLAQVVPIVSAKLRDLLGVHSTGGGGGES